MSAQLHVKRDFRLVFSILDTRCTMFLWWSYGVTKFDCVENYSHFERAFALITRILLSLIDKGRR